MIFTKRDSNAVVGVILGIIIIVAVAAYFVLHQADAPAATVTVTVIEDQSCLKCQSTNPVVNSLKNNDVPVSSWNIYNYNSSEGKMLIEKYDIERAPAIIISSNLMDYEFPKQLFNASNLLMSDDSYIFYLNPPFRNLSADRIDGLVDIYYVIDSTCKDCYNFTIHGDELAQNFKVVFGSALYFDVSFPIGEQFADRYNITAVPTYVLTADAKNYPRLTQVWPSVGTIEDNGYYVFRNVSQAGTYKNLTSGKITNQTK